MGRHPPSFFILIWYKFNQKQWYHNYSTTRTKPYHGFMVNALWIVGTFQKLITFRKGVRKNLSDGGLARNKG